VKLKYPEGEIDLTVSDSLSANPRSTYDFRGRTVPIETPIEIALKKLYHRAAELKPRDIFDIGVVLSTGDEAGLMQQLAVLAPVKAKLENRLAMLPEAYHQAALAELEIFKAWEHLKARSQPMVAKLVKAIPSP
jgi:hypothetical protein